MRRVCVGLLTVAVATGGATTATAAPRPDSGSGSNADLNADPSEGRVVDERTRHPLCRFGPIPEIARDGFCAPRLEGRLGATSHPGQGELAEQAVMAQQRHLNRLFDGYGVAPLSVDGDSGDVTEQRLCAFRLAAGLPVSTDDMEPGSSEERTLFATDELPILDSPATTTSRWIVIDQRCQMMFVGAGAEHLQFVFPTSTGRQPFPTRPQDRTRAYRYNPASHNNGWHNSLTYPASSDNPLNGNMYRPLYFDGGQAIHGANNVPRSPASHGCARLRVHHQDDLLDWLGLLGSGATRSRDRIDVTVTVQGRWQG